MAANAASQSLHLPEQMTQSHSVFFAVFTTLVNGDVDQLKQHLPEHLQFIKGLRAKGTIILSGPFYTPDGNNSGDGIYVLQVDNLEEARAIADQDPLHRQGIRKPDVRPWVRDDE